MCLFLDLWSTGLLRLMIAFCEELGLAGIGVVCRDHAGQAIAALCQSLGKV